MFESITFETILQGMIDAVKERDSTIDTREGSLIYTALAPAAVELQNMYIALDAVLNETFADTASREHLILRCAERGITPGKATHAVLRGKFNKEVPIGARFSLGDLNYSVTEKISAGVYKLECETAGAKGNEQLGILIPIDYIAGLTSAELTEVLIPGEDEEETETLRKRYFAGLDSQAFGGNIADYREKVNALDGVGGVKVYPAWSGGGTVKLVIIASDYHVPSQALTSAVQTAIDPLENGGEGKGLAPIGHSVAVEGVAATAVNISTSITYQEGYVWEDIEASAQSAVEEYFLELAKGWADSENLIVRISQIETRLLNIAGVLDITGTTVNGTESNLTIGEDSIPVRGTVSG